MPDGSPSQIVYTPARRKDVGVLVMLAGPAGSGKTLSALLLARGLAGPEGKIAFCDTENERALYYANDFEFSHYSLHEPFRPARFEEAAVAAQQQKASVFICDSFSHEHVGPGGLLDYHEAELQRMAGNDFEKRERMKAAAWIKPKGEHKRLLQRLWQLNTHIILCCQAERKTVLQKIESGPKKGKIEFVDLGHQPVCGSDIPYAMTCSFMFATDRPGVPIVIKPLLHDMVPLFDLTKPIDQATGERIAAWARGEQPSAQQQPPPTQQQPDPPTESRQRKPPPTDAEIEAQAKAIAERFKGTTDLQSHQAIFKDKQVTRQIDWLQTNRAELYERDVLPAIKESFTRNKPQHSEQPKPEQPPPEEQPQ